MIDEIRWNSIRKIYYTVVLHVKTWFILFRIHNHLACKAVVASSFLPVPYFAANEKLQKWIDKK